jgi:hypothetical protein
MGWSGRGHHLCLISYIRSSTARLTGPMAAPVTLKEFVSCRETHRFPLPLADSWC